MPPKSLSLKVFTFYIPQMSPMNWLILFMFFSSMTAIVKSWIYFY